MLFNFIKSLIFESYQKFVSFYLYLILFSTKSNCYIKNYNLINKVQTIFLYNNFYINFNI